MDILEFRKRMALLPEPTTWLKPPNWEYWRWELWHKVQNSDSTRFFDWPCIFHTMLHNHWPDCIGVEFDYLMAHKPEWTGAMAWPGLGGTPDLHIGTKLSRSLIHQAYHLLYWEHSSGRRFEDLESIVEIGGGYGAMALLCRRLGFRGRYAIVDVPEFLLLQEYYLSQMELDLTCEFWTPNRLDELGEDSPFSLLLGLYSLSEIPYDERDRYLAYCPASSYLFLYSRYWERYNNLLYFQKWADSHRSDYRWHHIAIGHMPPDSWYTIGH